VTVTSDRLTLLGPDVLLLAMGGGRPNNAVFVVECDGALDTARVAQAVDRLAPVAPFMACRLERPFPWGRLRWRAIDARPAVVERRLAAGEAIDAMIDGVLNAVVDPRREPPLSWHVVVASDAARSWLVLTWVHPLMDPRGAELLVAMLDAVDHGDEGVAWAAARPLAPPDDPRSGRERAALARRAMPHLRALARERPPSLADGRTPGRVQHRRRVVRAGARAVPVTLALVGRAVARLWRERGAVPALPFVVPISVDRRRKGEPGPVFGNFVSFHFARFLPADGEPVAATAAAIRRDMADAVRDDLVEALWAGMSVIRHYPPRHLLRPLGGREVASFHCADTGEVRPAPATLVGVPIRGAFHAPCVQPHPGLGVFFSRMGACESIVAVWVEGAVTAAEIERLLDDVEREVVAAPAA
jgi:hypothetical protein